MKYIIITSGNALIVNNVTILGNVVIRTESNYIIILQDGKELTRMLWNDILTIDATEPTSLEDAYTLLQASVSALVPNNQLIDLKDVRAGTPSNNQVLTYDDVKKKWVNADPQAIAGSGNSRVQVFQLQGIDCLVRGPISIGTTTTGKGRFIVDKTYVIAKIITPTDRGAPTAGKLDCGIDPLFNTIFINFDVRVNATVDIPQFPSTKAVTIDEGTEIFVDVSVEVVDFDVYTIDLYITGFYENA